MNRTRHGGGPRSAFPCAPHKTEQGEWRKLASVAGLVCLWLFSFALGPCHRVNFILRHEGGWPNDAGATALSGSRGTSQCRPGVRLSLALHGRDDRDLRGEDGGVT